MGSLNLRPDRPIVLTPMTGADIVLEAVALISVLVTLAIAAYGAVNLPEIIPTHVGPGGIVDSYGSKWLFIIFISFNNIVLYAFITFINQYPWVFNYLVIVTTENAPGLYRIAQRMMRWIKLVFCWQFAMMSGWFVLLLPYHPNLSAYSILILLPFLFITGIILLYSVTLMVNEASKTGRA